MHLAGAPIMMFLNKYAREMPISKTCNPDEPLNNILKRQGWLYASFLYLVNIKPQMVIMIKLQFQKFGAEVWSETPH